MTQDQCTSRHFPFLQTSEDKRSARRQCPVSFHSVERKDEKEIRRAKINFVLISSMDRKYHYIE
jgi:hypothetical protein